MFAWYVEDSVGRTGWRDGWGGIDAKELLGVSTGLTGNKGGRKVRGGKMRKGSKTDDIRSADGGGRSGDERQESR